MMLKMGSLFSGIGGLDLGLERAFKGQLQTAWQVEKEPFCRSVLERHWPNTKRYNNVLHVGAHNLEPVDVICAGFPCQSISIAGHMKGLEDEEKSGLWWQVHRLISEFQSIGHQPILVLENVANIIRVGGPDVVGSLTAIGYDCEWTTISAAQCGAPHLRRRWFAIAYPSTIGYYMRNELAFADTNGIAIAQVSTTKSTSRTTKDWNTGTRPNGGDIRISSETGSTTNTNSIGCGSGSDTQREHQHRVHREGDTTQGIQQRSEWQSGVGKDSNASTNTISTRTQVQAEGEQSSQQVSGSKSKTYWQGFPTQSPVCRRNDGIPNRVDRLKSLGNAVVPQCAEWVGQQIIKSNLLGERYVRN
jgi:DNA (cytosine-5)-methyltransferase 1